MSTTATKQPRPDKARRNRIEEEWNAFRRTLPLGATRTQIQQVRDLFYSGALALARITQAGVDSEVTGEWWFECLDELADYKEDLKRRVLAAEHAAQNGDRAKT